MVCGEGVLQYGMQMVACCSVMVWCNIAGLLHNQALYFDPYSMEYDVFGLLSHKGYLKGESHGCHVTVT